MILGPGFVIATPTKCGTHSYEALANRTPGMEMIRPQHCMDVPEERRADDIFMAVRDPYDRLVSMWTFICHSPNKTQWGGKLMAGSTFRQFLTWFVREQALADERVWRMGRSPWTWTKSLSQCYERLTETADRALGALQIEDADANLDWLVRVYGIRPNRETMYHSNRADKWRPKYSWNNSTIALANEAGAAADAELFGYEVK